MELPVKPHFRRLFGRLVGWLVGRSVRLIISAGSYTFKLLAEHLCKISGFKMIETGSLTIVCYKTMLVQ